MQHSIKARCSGPNALWPGGGPRARNLVLRSPASSSATPHSFGCLCFRVAFIYTQYMCYFIHIYIYI